MGLIDTGVRLTLRLPEDLRDKLLIHANTSGRSMNSEIISILSKWLSSKTTQTTGAISEPRAHYNSNNHALLLEKCSSLSVAQTEILLAFLCEWDAAHQQ